MEAITLNVQGMKCNGCEKLVEGALQGKPGVATIKADHKTATVTVEFDPAAISLDTIKQYIRGEGYTVA